MSDFFTWITDNKESVIGVLTGVVTIASIVATLTPNESDNKIVDKFSKVVSWLALNIGKAKSK
tara:strand:- start:596 stop:784 length:189 start_codon:yes stop_codon:yes gene_type:complete